MTITNRRTYTDLEFDEYRKVPGYSFSRLKNPEPIPTTYKMRFGTLVDQYLFTPERYNGEQAALVKPVAAELRRVLGDAIQYGKPQLSITADFHHNGFTMPYKGRPDLVIGKLIVDLKVSSLDPIKAIQYFRYDWQTTGYMAGYGAEKIVLCSINPKTFKVTLIPIIPVYDWWEYQILCNGHPQTITLPGVTGS